MKTRWIAWVAAGGSLLWIALAVYNGSPITAFIAGAWFGVGGMMLGMEYEAKK